MSARVAVALLCLGALGALAPARAARQADVLRRSPDELARAPAERWQGFFEPEAGERIGAGLAPELRELLERAEERYRAAAYPGALEALYTALERAPDLPPALLLLGTTYFRLRRYGDAVTVYERFLEVAPSEVWRTQALAHGYYSLGRYEDARAHYGRVLALVPESVEAVRGLALAEHRLGRDEEALRLLERVVALDPVHVEGHAWRAQVLLDLGRPGDALDAARRATELDPWNPQPRYVEAQALWELGRDEEAAASEARWREIDRHAQAVRTLEADLLLAPGRFDLLERLLALQVAARNAPAVRDSLARMLRARPAEVSELDLRLRALDLLVELGDARGAHAAARGLEGACPEEPRAWERLERFYGSLGDRANQVRCAERRLRLGAR